MLAIYSVALQLVRDMKPLCEQVARSDPDHARQMRKAYKAVPLLIAEGCGSRGRNRKARYNLALGEARELSACVDVAIADGILDAVDDAVLDRLDRVQRTLNRLSR